MYRKQRLTPKLRKKQKIVVSTPQNLWYDTGNNPAQKGKTADMEKVEISGAALAPLFRLSRDAVCGIAQGRIVFSNPAACRLFGTDVTGESAAERFPDLEENGWGDSFAAVLTIGDTPRNITAVRSGEILVLTIRTEEPETLPVPPTALRQMRSAAFNLRLSIEQLLKDEPETWDEDYDEERAKVSAVLYHSYYKLLHVTNQLADLNALAADDKLSWPKPLSFGDLIADLVDSAEIFLRRRNITFRFDPAGESLFVIGEQSKLEQLLLILIADCVRRTGDGGKIVFRLRQFGRRCQLTVCDDGPGLTEEELAEAFAPRREDTLTGTPDAGLGLTIAQGLARLHGGVLVLRNGEGGETSMHLQLPLTGKLPLRDAHPIAAGPELILTELSELLPSEMYQRKYRD